MGVQLLITLLALCPLVSIQDEPAEKPSAPIESELTSADEVVVKRLLKEFATHDKAGDSPALVATLREMAAFDNEEFLAAGLEGLKYKASKADKAAAKLEAEELGLRGKDELETLALERVTAVQASAARLLGNHRGQKKATSALARAFKDKDLRKKRPQAFAAVILSLGKLEYRKTESDVYSLFKSNPKEDIARACVRYFGLIKCKDKSIVRTLCEELSAPAPANVDGATNPPAGYWEQRWKTWNAVRRDVSWALKEITGQVFKPTEGEHPSDTRKALEYVKKNAKELGIR